MDHFTCFAVFCCLIGYIGIHNHNGEFLLTTQNTEEFARFLFLLAIIYFGVLNTIFITKKDYSRLGSQLLWNALNLKSYKEK